MPKTSTRSRPVVISDAELAKSVSPQSVDVYRPDDRDLRILMDRAVTEDDWLSIFVKAKEIALGGGQVGIKAMDFLAKYRFGLPAAMTKQDEERKPILMVEVVRGQTVVDEVENTHKPVAEEPPSASSDSEIPF